VNTSIIWGACDVSRLTVVKMFRMPSEQQSLSLSAVCGETAGVSESGQPSQSVSAQTDSLSMTDDPEDLSYQPSGSQSTSQSSVATVSVVNDRKFTVFESQLDELLCHLNCPTCHCPCSMDDLIKSCNEGTVLHVVAQCVSGHTILHWLL